MERRLTAILCADVVGYSRLMGADEEGTLERWSAFRTELIDPAIATWEGRLFKNMGDGFLVEFPSVVRALEFALAIQAGMHNRNSGEPDERRMNLRIGINLGDVLSDGEDLFGEGVNIAARIQAVSPVGGVALSEFARQQVGRRLPVAFLDKGPQHFKNIAEPIRIFTVSVTPARSLSRTEEISPARPSVAVLPFVNMSGDLEQEYFSDGITEDITTDLSKISALAVTARNTAFSYKGQAQNVRGTAEEIGVSHLLQGSVRKDGSRVRISAQLIEGKSGHQLWAERFDRELTDIFQIQDEISHAIVDALKLRLLPQEKKAIEHRGTDSAEAYDLYLMARNSLITGNHGDRRRDEKVIRLCRRAIEVDPSYARAWGLMALAQVSLRFSSGLDSDTGLDAAERALSLDPTIAEAHCAKAHNLYETGDLEGASTEIERALELDSESWEVQREAARLFMARKDFKRAARHFEKAVAVVESDYVSWAVLATCYQALGDRESVLRIAHMMVTQSDNALAEDPNNGSALGVCAGGLAILGEADRAKKQIERAILIDPDNLNLRYNFACVLAAYLDEPEAALTLLEPVLQGANLTLINAAAVDPDFDRLRSDGRFERMLQEAKDRLGSRAVNGVNKK